MDSGQEVDFTTLKGVVILPFKTMKVPFQWRVWHRGHGNDDYRGINDFKLQLVLSI